MPQITYKQGMSRPNVTGRLTAKRYARDWTVSYWIQFADGEVFTVDETLRRTMHSDVSARMIEMAAAHDRPIVDFRFKAQTV